jgi:hypothetical protein
MQAKQGLKNQRILLNLTLIFTFNRQITLQVLRIKNRKIKIKKIKYIVVLLAANRSEKLSQKEHHN